MKVIIASIGCALVILAGGCVRPNKSSPQAAMRYAVVRATPLGQPDRWDYVHYDRSHDRVYVAHNTRIDVVNGSSGALVGRIPDIDGAHGVVTIPALERGYAANGRSGEVTVFDLATLKTLGSIPADKDADAMTYDDATGTIVVADGDSNNVALIDAKAGARVARVPLDGGPEGVITDGHGTLYVNIEDKRQIARISLANRKIDAVWSMPDCESPHGLAIDPATHRLFASCRNSLLLVVDSDNGKVLKSVHIGRGSDTVVFDPVHRLIFSSNYDGTLSVIVEKSASDYSLLGNMPAAPGARTMAEDPASGRVFVATADLQQPQSASRNGDFKRFEFKPGSVKLLTFAPFIE